MIDRQAEPGTGADRFGREEGVENPVDDLRRYTGAGIGNFNADLVVLLPRAQGDDAALGDGLRGVDQEVHENLVQL